MELGNSKAGLPGSSSSQFQGNASAAPIINPFLFNVQVREIPDYGRVQSRGMELVYGLGMEQRVVTPMPSQARRPTDSTNFLQHILVRYIKFIAGTVDDGGKQQKFVYRLHWSVCFINKICECERYCNLILHFDGCRYIDCKLCQPVRLYGYARKIGSWAAFQPPSTSELGNHNAYYVSGGRDSIVQDIEADPQPKRRKMEDFVAAESRSAIAINQPVGGGVDSTEKMNEAPAATDGSMLSRKLDMEQLPERSHATLNDQAPESTGNLGNSLQNVGEAISHSEEHNRVDEQQGVDRDSTSQEDDLWEFCDTLDIFIDLDSIGLGEQELGYVENSNNVVDLDDNIYIGLQQQEIGSAENSNINVLDHDHDDNIGLQQLEIGSVENSNINILDHDDNIGLEQQEIGSVENSNNVLDHDDNTGLQQQEMVCVENRQVEIDETFSCQSPNSNGVSAHPPSFKATTQSKLNRIDAKQCERKLDDSKGASFVDFFTPEQITDHLISLNPDINLESNSRREVGENTCQLCGLEEITFTVLDKFCATCEGRIRHDSIYYGTKDDAGVQYCFCSACFKNAPRGYISCRGLSFRKSQLCKIKNNEVSYEKWVQCDKCEQWQHQICGLYNAELDLKRKANYTCPFCRLIEIEAYGYVSVTPASGVHDLPRTKLSDFIEERLFRSLEHDRKHRAELLGKNREDVPGVADLTVRVVLSVDKQLRVSQKFLDFLHDETYPTEFPYKSKVILLFQKVAGVDVCLFAMYVQEYGSECVNPNKRCVYISYLDSVKYFTPEIKSATGAALRTLVYHEILIGYLDYCKRHGFVNCYIWSCPSSKGDDYILHCHPETQKRPHPHKLVQWYKKMLRKAKEEDVVVGYTNFYDHFCKDDSNSSKLAARLPYLDGDYWPRAIEDLLQSIDHKDNVGGSEKHSTKRAMKAMGLTDPSIDVMEKLREKMMHAKDEFIIIHLHFTCMHCREAILSGSCWSCYQCRNFHFCSRCYELELDKHPQLHGYKHQLHERPVIEAAGDTDDKDVVLDNDIFRERHSFLNLCEKNNFRFDSLRRAAHSSLMIVHHLHATAMETRNKCEEEEGEGEEEEEINASGSASTRFE